MTTNDFIVEMKKVGYTVQLESDEKVKIVKDGNEIILSFEKIRRIFMNALVSHIDNNN